MLLFSVCSGGHPTKHAASAREENQDNSQQPSRSGSIPAMLPKPPLTPLVKLVGKVYSLKCRSVYKIQNVEIHIPNITNTKARLLCSEPGSQCVSAAHPYLQLFDHIVDCS